MLSIVIPTLNSERGLGATLEALVPGALSGLVSQLVISDGGSSDATLTIADAVGADVVTGAAGRGPQLARGAEAARGRWLLFLARRHGAGAKLARQDQAVHRRGRPGARRLLSLSPQ
jgi:glycosyltransferase involved in cell wall biosynthesis